MSTNDNNISTIEDKTPLVNPGNYSPVTVEMKDTIGATFLGILSFILLIEWMRSEGRNRVLVKQLDLS